MATTNGLVQRILWSAAAVLVMIGPSPVSGIFILVTFGATDRASVRRVKKSAVNMLARAKVAGYPVSVKYGSDGTLEEATLGEFDICPAGRAIHGDFYSITGSGIPADAEIVFDSETTTVTVAPDMVRPHWALLSNLPAEVPLGRNHVRLQTATWASDPVPIDVTAGPRQAVRTHYSGKPSRRPYTFAIVANPGIETAEGPFVADAVLTSPASFRRVLECCLLSLLTMNEDILRQNDWDRQMRFISVCDTTLAATDAHSLAKEDVDENGEETLIMRPRRERVVGFLSHYGIEADIVIVTYSSATHFQASAAATTDDSQPARGVTPFTYDGSPRVHGHFPRIPGSFTLSSGNGGRNQTVVHEFGHAASDYYNGRVRDLYNDDPTDSFAINKKWRVQATDPIPAVFANYNGIDFASDPNRDSLGYPDDWISYHPELIDPGNPNLMDRYDFAPDGRLASRLDRLTYAWLTDRLAAKLNR